MQKNYNQGCDSEFYESYVDMKHLRRTTTPPTNMFARRYKMTCPFSDPKKWTIGPPLTSQGKESCRKCHATAKAFSAFPCSPQQEEFVSTSRLPPLLPLTPPLTPPF